MLFTKYDATSNNLYCAKAKWQQQIFTVRKRSGSNKSLLCESEATATTNLYCAKAKRQQHISKKREGKDVK